MRLLYLIIDTAAEMAVAVVPILSVLLGFQVFVLRRPLVNARSIAVGCLLMFLGLTLLLVGLQEALFPIGWTMAEQLLPAMEGNATAKGRSGWWGFFLVFSFAAAIGFSTAIAEPALIAVASKARLLSGGTVPAFGLRLAVAIGAGAGAALGVLRLLMGWPIPPLLAICCAIVIVQTAFAPRMIVPLAYDVGSVTTSTVAVPVVAALGLALATALPGRNPLADGFGLIAFACLCSIMSVLAFATAADRLQRRRQRRRDRDRGTQGG
jgi:hypothetical protein